MKRLGTYPAGAPTLNLQLRLFAYTVSANPSTADKYRMPPALRDTVPPVAVQKLLPWKTVMPTPVLVTLPSEVKTKARPKGESLLVMERRPTWGLGLTAVPLRLANVVVPESVAWAYKVK